MKKIASVLSILMFALGLTACNTMKGFGQDVEKGGQKVESSAERHSSSGTSDTSTSGTSSTNK